MKLWVKTKEYSEGKYLVVRRDGTIPHWPHFVMGGDDSCAPAALEAYANEAARRGLDPEYVNSIRELAAEWSYRHATQGTGKADPDAPPHRHDNQAILSLMRHENDLTDLQFGTQGLHSTRDSGVKINE
jgi:hypothetical protein